MIAQGRESEIRVSYSRYLCSFCVNAGAPSAVRVTGVEKGPDCGMAYGSDQRGKFFRRRRDFLGQEEVSTARVMPADRAAGASSLVQGIGSLVSSKGGD